MFVSVHAAHQEITEARCPPDIVLFEHSASCNFYIMLTLARVKECPIMIGTSQMRLANVLILKTAQD